MTAETDFLREANLIGPFTPREREILTHMVENRSNQEIAEALVLSLNTVKWYARQIYSKLHVKNHKQAVTDLS